MIRKRKNFLVYKTKRYLIFLFCSKFILSQSMSYYSKSVNPGKSDEFTQDFTIYRIGKEIRASYRTISGGYDSPDCYYFGEADTDNQSIIYLNSICSSEGESYNGGEIKVEFEDKTATTVIMVSGGYPEDYKKGDEISGLDKMEGSIIFHAGTKKDNGKVFTNGGRVIAVTSYGKDFNSALKQSYKNTEIIDWEKKYFRSDLGFDLQKYLN